MTRPSADDQSTGGGELKHGAATRRLRALRSALFFLLAVAVVVGAYYWAGARARSSQLHRYHSLLMDTDVELAFQTGSAREASAVQEAVFGEMVRLEGLLSRSREGSDIDRVNNRAGREPVVVNPETAAVAAAALHYASLSDGAFDPTVAPLLDRWGFLGREFRVPAPEELEAVLPLVDYTRVELDPAAGRIYLPRKGMSLDLGGIAKGYIVDRGMALLREAGIRHAFLNAGGDIALLGGKPDGTPWRIGVRHPREPGECIAVLSLEGGAVVTSGDYERLFTAGGRSYHHILDPRSGYPAAELASVTVLAGTAMEADALSTAVFVLGPERGLSLVESLSGVEALLITVDLEMITSTGLDGRVERLEEKQVPAANTIGERKAI